VTLSIEQRVQNGIDLLDQLGPKDWRQKVILKDFNIAHGCKCVLGFVFGNGEEIETEFDGLKRRRNGFGIGQDVLGCYPDDNGFDAYGPADLMPNDEYRRLIDIEYAELQAEWVRRLSETGDAPVAVAQPSCRVRRSKPNCVTI